MFSEKDIFIFANSFPNQPPRKTMWHSTNNIWINDRIIFDLCHSMVGGLQPKISRNFRLQAPYHWMAEVKNDSIIDSDIICRMPHSFTRRLIWKWISENENVLFRKQTSSRLQAKKSFKTLEKSKKIRYNMNNHLS